ncbi:MAG: type VI secretion system tip protein VgrG [Deltaproteobacteria bacterium]|nr:type VI secretion system tip protein VgrG [Deltaproteobacteria bacterium]
MELLKLSFANGETLSVREFRVREEMSRPFEIAVIARGSNPDVDFEALIGERGEFRLQSPAKHAFVGSRRWTGVCVSCEQLQVEAGGLSTYEVVLAPTLWLLQHRRNYRLFQHKSVIEIATVLMEEWKIEHHFKLEPEKYPSLELRTQYDESDFAFMSRLLEEAGISFYFVEDGERGSVLVFDDAPHLVDPRAPLKFEDTVEQAKAAGLEYCTKVRSRRELKPGRVVLRDHDFRNPRFELFGNAMSRATASNAGIENLLEQYHYVPGRFLTEGHALDETPTADDLGVARSNPTTGALLAERILEGTRVRRRRIQFETNAYGVAPGTTLTISGHPRNELHPNSRLLMVALDIGGTLDGEWSAVGESVFCDVPYRPLLVTPKPRINGVQSAVIVGPEQETVYTDEFGRVRVQFPWDRAGRFNPWSSCWMRVTQAWAGPGYGLFNLPRVGHEVLVAFVDGDPDQPIVTGNVFNGAQRVPYPLPGSKMMSGWKSDSNSNIMLFDDTPGDEMFYTQAERSRLDIVKRNAAVLTGGSRTEWFGNAHKTLSLTSTTHVAKGNQNTLAGITNKQVAAVSWKAEGGLSVSMKSGRKIEHVVVPILPFITALMDVREAEEAILAKLPGGKAPDLQQVLPPSAGGPKAAPEPEPQPPVEMSEADIEKKLQSAMSVVGLAVAQFEPDEVEAMAEQDGLNGAVDAMLDGVRKKGGDAAIAAFATAKDLTTQLQAIKLANENNKVKSGKGNLKKNPKGSKSAVDQKQKEKMFQMLLLAIIEAVLPKTKITIGHQKIELETKDAKIKLEKENISLEAKGDIEIKADGKISIKGKSLELSPPPPR